MCKRNLEFFSVKPGGLWNAGWAHYTGAFLYPFLLNTEGDPVKKFVDFFTSETGNTQNIVLDYDNTLYSEFFKL